MGSPRCSARKHSPIRVARLCWQFERWTVKARSRQCSTFYPHSEESELIVTCANAADICRDSAFKVTRAFTLSALLTGGLFSSAVVQAIRSLR